jgi:hypothetical protein
MQAGRPTALIAADMRNRYEHEDGERLLASARGVARPLAKLIERRANARS